MVEESQIAQEICQMFGIRVSVSQVFRCWDTLGCTI